MTREIQLSRGMAAIVDDEDYSFLLSFTWFADPCSPRRKTFRARHNFCVNGSTRALLMHRLVAAVSHADVVDHINHNPLDNRRCNLRICSHEENAFNRINTKHSSVYKGVTWHKAANAWCAQIASNGIKRHLGCFKDELDAAAAYDTAAILIHGEFACTNRTLGLLTNPTKLPSLKGGI